MEGDHVHHLPDALFSVEWPWLMSNSIKLFNKTSYYVKTFIEGDHVQWTKVAKLLTKCCQPACWVP